MWKTGTITLNGQELYYEMKWFPNPSPFGIQSGRISKLGVYVNHQLILHYERGWDIVPTTDFAKQALQYFLDNFN